MIFAEMRKKGESIMAQTIFESIEHAQVIYMTTANNRTKLAALMTMHIDPNELTEEELTMVENILQTIEKEDGTDITKEQKEFLQKKLPQKEQKQEVWHYEEEEDEEEEDEEEPEGPAGIAKTITEGIAEAMRKALSEIMST